MLPQRNAVAAVAAASITVVLAACAGAQGATVSPTDFVTAHAADAHSIIVSVQEVQTGVGNMSHDSDASNPAALASFDAVLSDAQSSFDKVNQVLLDGPKPRGVEASETEMCSATDELSDAMKSARAYVDNQKPSDLADYKKHWDQGRAWWNHAVTLIWQAAAVPAPTIENAPAAPPVS